MSLRHPVLTYTVIILILVILAAYMVYRLYFRRNKITDDQKKKYYGYGAMWLVEGLPGYRLRKIMHRIFSMIGILALLASMISTGVLMGRPSYREEVTTGIQRRDIFLCLDVSYSLYALNYDFVNNLESVVKGLDGDRIGISVYNTATVLYMPMTDDKEFAVSKIEELKDYFTVQKEYMEKYGDLEDLSSLSDQELEDYNELYDKLNAFDAGMIVNSNQRGSSLIGEGLASCLYNFPSLNDSKRTRLIFMVTDNAENALERPDIELDEAASLCSKNDVKVFGIFPPEKFFETDNGWYDYGELKSEMKSAVEKTGGAFYVATDDLDTKAIVKKIQENKAMQVNEITMVKTTDVPQIPIMVCIAGLLIFALVRAGGV